MGNHGEQNQQHDKHSASSEEHGHFIVPLKMYHLTIFGLLVLTVITVAVSYTSFGSTAANLAVAMAIASAKAMLVMLVFMGLRWDNLMNRLSMAGTFVALAVFVWLTSADLWHRVHEKPLAIKKPPAVFGMADIERWETEISPEKIARGKELYANNCASCHGANGLGDGPAGAALNPKPRNFQSPGADWKNGNSIKSIYITLAEGIKGSGMAAFTALSAEDRFALTHYLRKMAEIQSNQGKADTRFAEVLEKVDGVGANAVAKETIPVDLALELMLGDQKQQKL